MKQRALIIEDRPEVAIIYGRSLEELEFEVCNAANLREAYLALAKIPPPDLVILDLNLGITETAEFTVRQIAKIKSYNPEMVVVVVSGMLTPELIKVALDQGAQEVKDKMDWRVQVDVWRTLEKCFNEVPSKAKDRLAHPLELLKRLLPVGIAFFIGKLGR